MGSARPVPHPVKMQAHRTLRIGIIKHPERLWCRNGDPQLFPKLPDQSLFRRFAGQAVMAQEEIPVRVDLGRGVAEAQIWTCDLSYDYVRINADYRS